MDRITDDLIARLTRIEDKVDGIAIASGVQEARLQDHGRRILELDQDMEHVKRHVYFVQNTGKITIGFASLIATVVGIIKLLKGI